MNNENEKIKEMLNAFHAPRTDKIPSGWFCRREVEDHFDVSEATAIRFIRKIQKMNGYKEKVFWVNGKKVPFYTVEAPSEPRRSEGFEDSTDADPTGEQTNPPTLSQSDIDIIANSFFVNPYKKNLS